MSSIFTLSVVGVVVAFLIGILASFPIEGISTTFDSSDESFSVEAVQETGRLSSGNFMSLIDDIASYQKDPDYRRAEARRQDMVNLGNTLTGKFQDFGERLEGDLDKLVELEPAESEATQAQ